MVLNSTVIDFTVINERLSYTWAEYFRNKFMNSSQDLPEIILILPLICTVGAFLNLHVRNFPIPISVILLLLGCSFEILSFTSDQVQRYADAIQWMDPHLFFDLFTPVIFFNVAFDIDVYMLHKTIWQILLITVPGLLINYALSLWYLTSVHKLNLKSLPWLLFSAILVCSDPMLTAASIRKLDLPKDLINLIKGESLVTSIITFITFNSIVNINTSVKKMNNSLAHKIMNEIWSYYLASILFGILSSKLIQFWMSAVFGDDVNHISLSFSVLYLIYFICESVGMSGILTMAIMGLFLNSTSFKPGVEVLLLEFWNCLSFVAFLMVFTFTGLLIPAHTYLYISLSDVYYSLNVYLTITAIRFLVILLLSPFLSRLGNGFNWRWAFIMIWSETRGIPNINMALLFAYSDVSLAQDKEKLQVLFHGVAVCVLTQMVNKIVLPMAVNKLRRHDVTSTKYKSHYNTFQHFQKITKSAASALKFDKDLANADWSIVENAIALQNPYTLSQKGTTEHIKVSCPNCNMEIDETLSSEAMDLANRRILSAQIASYQRQYTCETLSQNAVQMLVGAAGSFDEKGECMSPETIKNYSESKKIITVFRKLLLNWVYNTKKEKGIPSRHYFLHVCHKIVFTDEFEYVGYLVILMNLFPLILCFIPTLYDIYENELRYSNYSFLGFYILEALIKIAAMRKEYFLHTWNLFEFAITFVGIIDIIFTETDFINPFDLIQIEIFLKAVRFIRILRILKLITPSLLQFIDKRMSHQLSFRYDILKGYIQGQADIMTIIDQISSSKQVKQELLTRIMRNTVQAMKELGYLEYDHPEIAVTMKTKEQINVLLNLAREIVKVFRLKGILHKIEASEINKLITTRKKDLLNFKPVIKPLTAVEALYHIPWLDKNKKHIKFFKEIIKFVTYDCGNDIFEEGDEPKGIYIIISGMVKLRRSKPGWLIDQIFWKLEEKDNQITYIDYVLGGEIIGELNCLTNEPMRYSATCKTVVETYFIPKNHLDEAFRQCGPHIEYKMWQKLGLSITAQKFRGDLSYEDWSYKMQLRLRNIHVKDIPKNTKTDIYDENVIYVILMHGAVEDCQLRRTYKAPFLIPSTCHQIQGTEDFTKVMIIQNSNDVREFEWDTSENVPSYKLPVPAASLSTTKIYEGGIQDESNFEIQQPTKSSDSVTEKMVIHKNT